MSFYRPLGESELLPRYVYLEPLLERARVLEVGAVTATGGRSAAFLRQRGARYVVALDSEPDHCTRAQREYASDPNIRFRAGSLQDLADEDPFDLVLVADAGAVLADARGLDGLARLAGPQGRIALGLRHLAGVSLAQIAGDETGAPPPTYGELVAQLRERFAFVEISTQSALFAYQLAPADAAEELDVQLDGTLVEGEESAYFLALCGAQPAGLAPTQALVALPGAPLAVAAGRRTEVSERLRFAEKSLADARAEAEAARRDKEDLELRLVQALDEAEAGRLEVEETLSRERAAELRAQEAERGVLPPVERVRQLERLLIERTRELGALRQGPEAGGADEELGRLRQQVSELDRAREEHAASVRDLQGKLDEERTRTQQLEREAEQFAASRQALEAEVAAQTAQARELARDLEAAHRRIEELESATAPSPGAPEHH